MKKMIPFWAALCLGLLLTACGGSAESATESSSASETTSSAEETPSEDPAERMAKAAGEMQEAMKKMNKGEEVEVVDFREMKKVLPESMIGLPRTDYTGEKTGAFGMKVSSAGAAYEEGDKRIDINIADTGGMGMAMMGLAAWSQVDVERETEDEYERTIMIDGHKAYEKYNSRTRSGQTSIIIGDRLVINVEVENLTDKEMSQVVRKLDVKQLERLL